MLDAPSALGRGSVVVRSSAAHGGHTGGHTMGAAGVVGADR